MAGGDTGWTRRVRLRSGAYTATDAAGQVTLLHGGQRGEHIGTLTEAGRALLRRLGATEHAEPELLATLGPDERTLLHRLSAGGWLTVHCGYRDRALITIRPLGPHRDPRPPRPVAPRLSRFALLRRDTDELVLESPRCRAAIVVHDPEVLTVIHGLAGSGWPDPAVGLPPRVVADLVAELAWYGFVHEAEEDVRPDLATEQWSPHELWFHSRSRGGHHDRPFGATLWAAGRHPPLPARRPAWSGTAVALPKPGPDPLGPTLDAALDARRSIRTWDDTRPMALTQLGEFLYRVARVRMLAMGGKLGSEHEVSMRPSPSGGAMHGLELYPVVTNVDGVAAGMYHYDPFDHVLEPVHQASPHATRQLVGQASLAAGGTPSPHVLLVISARFGRVMWKYQSMGYALILKDLGALIQTMYLVATAMGLAPCALGAGDADLFARATGLDPLVEGSVGELLLGSPPTT